MGRHRYIGTNAPSYRLRITRDEWHMVVKHLSLSPRETEIIKFVFAGRTDKQIANELRISGHTVRAHLRHIFARIGVGGRMELAMHIFSLIHESHHHNG